MERNRLGCEVLPSSFYSKHSYQAFFGSGAAAHPDDIGWYLNWLFPFFTTKYAIIDCFPLSLILEEQFQLFDLVQEMFPLKWQQSETAA